METSIMRPMRLAIKRLPRSPIPVSDVALVFVMAVLFSISAGAQKSAILLDLTTPPPRDQRGLGVAGGTGGGVVGQASNKPELPIQVKIVGASVARSNDFILKVNVENVGRTAIELPISRNYSDVERKPGTFRRELLFVIRPVTTKSSLPIVVGSTVGSRVVLQSFVRLEPQESFQALLRVESSWVRSSLPKNERELQFRVTCEEWALEDGRFFIESTTREIASDNTATLGFNNDTPIAAVSGP